MLLERAPKSHRGFTLIELLTVIAIIGVLSAIGIPAYQNYILSARIAVAKANHNSLVRFAAAQFSLCGMGANVTFNNTMGSPTVLNCVGGVPAAITMINYINNHVYGSYQNPFPASNPSRCRPNVDNCSPPGYLNGCGITGADRYGMMSIFVVNPLTIQICTNIGPQNVPNVGTILINNIVME